MTKLVDLNGHPVVNPAAVPSVKRPELNVVDAGGTTILVLRQEREGLRIVGAAPDGLIEWRQVIGLLAVLPKFCGTAGAGV